MEYEPYKAEELWKFSKNLTSLTEEDKDELLRLIKELDEWIEDYAFQKIADKDGWG